MSSTFLENLMRLLGGVNIVTSISSKRQSTIFPHLSGESVERSSSALSKRSRSFGGLEEGIDWRSGVMTEWSPGITWGRVFRISDSSSQRRWRLPSARIIRPESDCGKGAALKLRPVLVLSTIRDTVLAAPFFIWSRRESKFRSS